MPIDDLESFQGKLKSITEAEFEKLKSAILKYGFSFPVFVWRKSILDGHQRVQAVKRLIDDGYELENGMLPVALIEAKDRKEAAEKLLLINSRYATIEQDGFDWFVQDFDIDVVDMSGLLEIPEIDFDQNSNNTLGDDNEKTTKLTERFIIPPFTIFDTRQGYWQDRKRAWIRLGIDSELGRGDNVKAPGGSLMPASDYTKSGKRGDSKGKCLETGIGAAYGRKEITGTSIFDPVLCEVIYTWFCPKNGRVIDPFAGGSVRGITAGYLGLNYFGVDLREEQIVANKMQFKEIFSKCINSNGIVEWIDGDSRNIDNLYDNLPADLLFSCPPYVNLEVYSDNEKDLSAMEYPDFITAYNEIIGKCYNLLQNDSFACFVVGEVRDKKGDYYNFVGETIAAFLRAGFKYYNEAILINSINTLPLRAPRAFEASRKLGKAHQNVLVFIKGDARVATNKLEKIDLNSIFDFDGGDTGCD